jgi:hypothetical protein
MSLSTETKTLSATTNVALKDDTPYPDRTVNATLTTSATTVLRVDGIDQTSDDMKSLFTWKYGEEIYGTHAKSHVGMNNYIKDINAAYGKQNDYKPYYIDTTKELGPQLKNMNK